MGEGLDRIIDERCALCWSRSAHLHGTRRYFECAGNVSGENVCVSRAIASRYAYLSKSRNTAVWKRPSVYRRATSYSSL